MKNKKGKVGEGGAVRMGGVKKSPATGGKPSAKKKGKPMKKAMKKPMMATF
jgi:hypothetical protein